MSTVPENDYSELFIRRLRQQVDRLDSRLLALLNQRIGVTREIGRLKRSARLPLRDAAREQELLARLIENANGGLSPDAIQKIFRSIMEVSLADEEADGSRQ